MSQTAVGADANYAESVAMTGHAEDANTTFDVRIARFPARGQGTLWMFAFVDGRQLGLVDETLELTSCEPTDVASPDATFTVTGRSTASLERNAAAMQGRASAHGLLRPSAHPEPGIGSIAVEIDITFSADHAPISVRSGRIEVMGRVRGTITIDGKAFPVDLPGKWHEQTGIRPQFAPAFTYLFVQGEQRGIMTSKHASGAWGYVYRDGSTTTVTEMKIEPYGHGERAFTATLEDDSTVRGVAKIVREVSVPVEGMRRPGATVVVESDMGRLVGVLNDWNPK